MSSNNKSGGGSATQLGINYQNRVAAWICTRILAESEVSPLWGWDSETSLEFLRCETEQPVDDILVGNSNGGFAFINVKSSISASRKDDSELGSVIHQFVRQFISYQGISQGERPWEKQINPERDRLVLVTKSSSPQLIKEHLPQVLAKIRNLHSGEHLNTLANNLPQSEKEIFEIFREQTAKAWVNGAGNDLEEAEELQFLKSIRIEVLDVEENMGSELEAQQILRKTVLQDPIQAELAWDSLIQACANYATRHSGADRALLQQHLIKKGLGLKAPRSYQNDIEKLRTQSEQTKDLLLEFSRIRIGQRQIKIERSSTEALLTAAENNSIVVVGEPGAGKSGALHDLVEQLTNQKRDLIFLAVDRLKADSLNELNNELNLEHSLIDIMTNWLDDKPGFLVIDALDAARSGSAAQTFYDLIALTLQKKSRWRVIASIRKFDLRHHQELRRLFSGTPPTQFKATEFSNLCHFNVPLLDSLEEWEQIFAKSPELLHLFQAAGESLRRLLIVPFNLRLAAELLGSGTSIERFSPLKTHIDLLDLYWEERVTQRDHQGDNRKAVLLKVVEAMIKSRELQVNRKDIISEPWVGESLHQLLSSHLLSERELPSGAVEDNVLSFAHHVLFDYAVSRLLFRGKTGNLLEKLESESDLVLTVRPSIVMYFQHLWFTDLPTFWEVYFNLIKSQQIPEIGKIMGASVATDFASQVENFAPLIRALHENISKRGIAEQAFRHLTGALMVVSTSESILKIIGETAPPWCELLDECTNPIRLSPAYSVRPLLWMICKNPDVFTKSQRNHAGNVARRLLKFALSLEPRDRGLIFSGLETVCQTFDSDPLESATILRQCLKPDHVKAFGHEELSHFADHLERLVLAAPQLVKELYEVAFTNYDTSDEKTNTLGSRILPLTSTRNQDFRMARYSLAHKFKLFLEAAPLPAVESLMVAIQEYIKQRGKESLWKSEVADTESDPENLAERFLFNEKEAFIITDHSSIWDDSSGYRDEDPIQMLYTFEHFLEKLSSDNQQIETRQKIINLIVKQNKYAVFWKRLINAAIKYPETLGMDIVTLAWAGPILTSFDTTVSIGNFISKIFGSLNEEDKIKIEKAILEIPDLAEAERFEQAERYRNRLLGCLPKEALVLEETERIIKQLEEEQNIPPNSPFFGSTQIFSSQYTDENYLTDEGVNLEDEKNRRIFDLTEPVKTFANKFQNESPINEDFINVISHLRSLYEALTSADVAEVHQRQQDLAWNYLTDACAAVAKLENFSCETEDAQFIKSILLESAEAPNPLPDPESEKHFDEHPSWSPSTRTNAAEGLMSLAHHGSCLDPNVIEKIKDLGLSDPVPAVRFQIATRLTSLYYSDLDLMWFMLETISQKENRFGILEFLVNGPLNRLAGHHPDEVFKMTKTIFERVRHETKAEKVRKHCTSIFLGLSLWRDHPQCQEMIQTISQSPEVYDTEAFQLVFNLREYLNLGLDDLTNKEKEKIRFQSFQILERVLSSTLEVIRRIEKQNEKLAFDSWTPEDQEFGKTLARLADSIGNQIYFASGAYQDQKDGIPMETEARVTFLIEVKNSLNLLAEFEYASLTHHLLQTLEFFIPYDPEEMFLLIAKVVLSGRQGGYQYESMGADLVVKLIERFIAEFPKLFQKNERCRQSLIEVLDVFIEAGWASARHLTYRLEDIFR